MKTAALCILSALAAAAVGAALAEDPNPALHIQNWSDLSCATSGNPVIRLFPAEHRFTVTCE